ncbi:endonuclease/exonuclease/phosphatase family protein [Nesterenkonia lutea]|uniref:3-phytase n=1 Tax=Nesterenkonia lutea TaxID=272919 RepID=A0ABR9JGN9_9MICC|nr:endonuclease/exonuclease/phosphatase family protein [Nesterenkonia lutea]MBE1525011.1 3-phytase [Nesterenkonia lutea]
MPNGQNSPALRAGGAMRSGLCTCLVTGLMLAGTTGASASAQAPNPNASTVDAPQRASGYPTPGQPAAPAGDDQPSTTVAKQESDVRVATLHAGLSADSSAELLEALQGGMDPSARMLAETVQINAPDVLVLTGVSYDESQQITETLNQQYLSRGQNGQTGMQYPYTFTAPTNSGIDSGADLDGDGRIGGPEDAIGYGRHAGERGMAVFSAHPIAEDEIRTFQEFLWQDMPGNAMPAGRFSELEQSVLRLPSTSMWDIPIEVPDQDKHVHVVATDLNSSPGSGALDTARNEDQRRLVADFVSDSSWYLYDDDGAYGGLDHGSSFVVAGGLAEERELLDFSTEEVPELSTLLEGDALQDPAPQAITEEPLPERRDPASDLQATQGLDSGGAVRASYVLPAAALDVEQTGVFWPAEGEFGYDLVDPDEPAAPAGRLVWLDIAGS